VNQFNFITAGESHGKGLIAIIEGLEKWCEAKGFKRVAALTGAMLDHPPRDTYEAGMMGIS